jgi:hypothetical protein
MLRDSIGFSFTEYDYHWEDDNTSKCQTNFYHPQFSAKNHLPNGVVGFFSCVPR